DWSSDVCSSDLDAFFNLSNSSLRTVSLSFPVTFRRVTVISSIAEFSLDSFLNILDVTFRFFNFFFLFFEYSHLFQLEYFRFLWLYLIPSAHFCFLYFDSRSILLFPIISLRQFLQKAKFYLSNSS